MLSEINCKLYVITDSWSELTIRKVAVLQRMTNELPDDVRAYLRGDDTELSDMKVLAKYKTDAMCLLSTIPVDVIEKIAYEDIDDIFNKSLLPFVLLTLGVNTYEPTGIESFMWGGEVLEFPKSDKDIMGEPTPMDSVLAKTFCDASDVASVGFDLAALFVAILCLPKGEMYDEAEVKRRAETMDDLPVNIYLELFFCSRQLMTIYDQNTLIATLRTKAQVKGAARR